MPTTTYVLPDIHQGPGLVWVNTLAPASGSRLLVDVNGNPTQGAPIFLGGSQGAIKISLKAKLEAVQIDQETAPVDVLMTGEEANIEMMLKESQLAKVAKMLIHSSYSSGTDTLLPAGAQNFEMITTGGLVTLLTQPVTIVSPRRGFTNPGKFFVFTLYKAFGVSDFEFSVTRTKESEYKVLFHGLADLTRPQGDRTSQLYRQT